jgi:peptidoglycan L-alanyl-D-glutamate endopeptidase CwlK
MSRIVIFLSIYAVFFSAKAQAPFIPVNLAEQQFRAELTESFSLPAPGHAWEFAPDTLDQWKKWALVENFSFGKNRGTLPMIADLQSLHPYFRDKVLELIRACRQKGIEIAVVETYRTHAKQNEYTSMGRRYTRAKAGHSKHQYGLAVDIVALKDSVPQWNNIALWRKIGVMGERLGLRWGGRWRRPFDPAHFEWTGGVGTYTLAQGTFPPVPKPSSYPCIAEDLKELKRHWKSWESEQAAIARKQPERSQARAHRAGDE